MKIRKRTIVSVVAAVYLVVVVAVATTFGIVSASKLVLSCHTARVSDDMYAYWQASERYNYVRRSSSTAASDTPLFWSLPAEDGTERTNEEAVAAATREKAERITAAAYLFDAEGNILTDAEREAATAFLDKKVEFSFSGDEDAFNRAAEPFGFTLAAAKRAEVLEKKAELLREVTSADPLQQDAYYKENYVRVKLAYVLSTDEAYADKCAMLRYALADEVTPEELATGADSFSSAVADAYYNADDTSRSHPDGYYFAKNADFTAENFRTLPEVIDAVLDLDAAGKYAELTTTVTTSSGSSETRTYFIRRYELDLLAYGEDQNEIFFGDFVSDATDHYFRIWCDETRAEVVWKEKHCPAWTPAGSGSELYKFF